MKKIVSATDLNQEVKALKSCCEQLEATSHAAIKQCYALNRKLEHVRWDKDVELQEIIIFTGTSREFIRLLLPLIRSPHWKVDGKSNREALLRVIDNVIKVQLDNGEFLKFSSLLDAVKRCLSE